MEDEGEMDSGEGKLIEKRNSNITRCNNHVLQRKYVICYNNGQEIL
jgi:hypothetical protein